MKKKKSEPRAPAERQTTVRAALRAALCEGPATARELSGAAGISEKDVAGHLEHLERSAKSRGEHLVVEPASCIACGFSFRDRQRLSKPGRCPACGSERIDPPAFRLEGARARVRPMRDEDKAQVREMMRALWPDEENPPYGVGSVFVHEREDGTLGGFVAFGERKWVDGCDTSPVCHVEGWWVAPELRRQGVGGALLRAVEAWAREKGYAELSSDTEVTNELSQRAHAALGFEVLDRIQYFRKKL